MRWRTSLSRSGVNRGGVRPGRSIMCPTNTATTGSYTSVITTKNGGTLVDQGTTAAVAPVL